MITDEQLKERIVEIETFMKQYPQLAKKAEVDLSIYKELLSLRETLIEERKAHDINVACYLNCHKEHTKLRGQKKALIEDGERLFHSLCAYLDYCQCADIKYKCYDPVGAIEHHRALLKDLEC